MESKFDFSKINTCTIIKVPKILKQVVIYIGSEPLEHCFPVLLEPIH